MVVDRDDDRPSRVVHSQNGHPDGQVDSEVETGAHNRCDGIVHLRPIGAAQIAHLNARPCRHLIHRHYRLCRFTIVLDEESAERGVSFDDVVYSRREGDGVEGAGQPQDRGHDVLGLRSAELVDHPQRLLFVGCGDHLRQFDIGDADPLTRRRRTGSGRRVHHGSESRHSR